MLHEISQFIEYLENKSPEVFSENLELKEGLYVFLEKDINKLVIKEENILKVEKKTKESDLSDREQKLYSEFKDRYYNSLMLSANKSYLGRPGTFNEIGSPFGIRFKKDALIKDNKEINNGKTKFDRNLSLYFFNAEIYLDNENNLQKGYLIDFRDFCNKELLSTIEDFSILKKYPTDKNIFLFYKSPATEDFKKVYQNYLKVKVFVKANDKGIGVSGDLNIGNEESKPFIQHKTAPFESNYQINGLLAKSIFNFFSLVNKNQIIPNPLPVFVDKNEAGKAVKFYKEDKSKGHKEIIEDLLKTNNFNDLQNYYLIYFQLNKKYKQKKIADLDFVPVFRYKTDDMPEIKNMFMLKEKGELKYYHPINNIFEFEKLIHDRIFLQYPNNSDFGYGILMGNYFSSEIKPYKGYSITETTYNLLYKYRKALYDYIYKSKEQAITSIMFYDIMSNSILDDIRHDEYKTDKKYHTKEFSIKEKLNIWFSLYSYFSQSKNIDMKNKTEQLFERIRKIGNPDGNDRMQTDEEFAFAGGQLIRTILNKSEAANRKHSLLEPFLQKTDAKMFKLAIAKAFDTYKHAFKFYKGNNRYEFDKIMSETMGFEPDEKNMKNLLPLILAGYFSETVFKKEEENE